MYIERYQGTANCLDGRFKHVQNFSTEVKKEISDDLFDMQLGSTPPVAKPFKGVGSGVFEIVTPHPTNT
jgi:phage-related protein